MYYLGSKAIRQNSSFEIEGTLYPSNWLQRSTEDEKTAVGITWVDDPVEQMTGSIGMVMQPYLKHLRM
jgi:hypothetical protein